MESKHPVEVFKYCPKCGNNELEVRYGRAIFCTSCSFEYFFNASGAVIALIFNNEGELLITRRAHNPWKGGLDLPGGFVDPNETLEHAVTREIKEELNLEVESLKYLFSSHNQYPYSGLKVFTVDAIFEVRVKSFESIEVMDDVAEYFFMHPKDFKKDMFAIQSCNEVLEKYFDLK